MSKMTSFTVSTAFRLNRFAFEIFSQISTRNTLKSSGIPFVLKSERKNYTTVTEEKKSNGPTESTGPPNESANDTQIKSEIELLNKEIVELKDSNSTLTDKYKRALADGENLRIRLLKQIEDAKLFGIQGFCKDLLDVADILGKATESVPKDQITDSNPHLKSLYEGLTMTEAQLHKAFKKHGLAVVNPLNEKFDPNQHEALFQQEVEGKKPGTIVVVSKVGYKLHERIVRPALVGVAKG